MICVRFLKIFVHIIIRKRKFIPLGFVRNGVVIPLGFVRNGVVIPLGFVRKGVVIPLGFVKKSPDFFVSFIINYYLCHRYQ